jgi:thiamine pyrophosphate-dependent acetolactate synthase large subunit-like protein
MQRKRRGGSVAETVFTAYNSRRADEPPPERASMTGTTPEDTRPSRVSEALGNALAGLGVEHVFGVLGSGNFWITHALRAAGARYLAARHECGAVCMADGYARASGRLGVATVHQGPGLTNAITGIAEAAKARTPLLVLAADTSAAAVRSNFRIEQDALVASVGAVPERIHSPDSALADLARAYRRATVDRRTVVLMLPLDIQAAEIPAASTLPAAPPLPPPVPGDAVVVEVADLLARARRPVILGGRGAVVSGARASLERLGELIGAVLVTSANGNGLFSGNPYCVGIAGGFASPIARELLAEADLLISFGASLNMWTTRHHTLPGPDAGVIQVDVEPEAIGVHRPVTTGIVADAAETARLLVTELERRGHRGTGFRTDGLGERITAGGWREQTHDPPSAEAGIDPRALTMRLDDLLPRERTVAIDSGHFMGWPAMYLAVPDAAGFVFNQSFQSIGLGLGAAIGAAVARPDRITLAALGDGGALMSLGDFETAARLRLKMLIVVYNDAAYGAEVHHFRPQGAAVDLVQFPDTDFAALGRAVGAGGITVRRADDLAPVSDWLRGPRGSLVVDAKIDRGLVAEWLEEAFRAH